MFSREECLCICPTTTTLYIYLYMHTRLDCPRKITGSSIVFVKVSTLNLNYSKCQRFFDKTLSSLKFLSWNNIDNSPQNKSTRDKLCCCCIAKQRRHTKSQNMGAEKLNFTSYIVKKSIFQVLHNILRRGSQVHLGNCITPYPQS